MSYTSDRSRNRFWEDQEGLCPLCGRPILDPLDKTESNIDHKTPKSHGGSDMRSNLQLTHSKCNNAKGCGCPPGDTFHLHGRLPQVTWRAQNFRCALCGEPINPSEINDTVRAKMDDGKLSHVPCIEEHYRQKHLREGTRSGKDRRRGLGV